jgi:CubicO group peptidase (beta-lactamase class C family)
MYNAASLPSPHGVDSAALAELEGLVNGAIEDEIFPGAVLLVGYRGETLLERAFGRKVYKDSKFTLESETALPMRADTVFDIAGLTNLLVTTTLLMKLVEFRQVKLEDRVSRYLQGFGVLGKSPITIAQLLSHSSGLAPWAPFYEDLVRENAGERMGILTSKGARDYVFNAINRSALKYEPGTRQVYSDIGFMLLGHLIEELTGLSLDRAAQRHVFQPLGLKSTSYIDLSMIRRRGIAPVTDLIAPTEECPWRKRTLCGEVSDDNAWAMGGIAGHSGVFSTARDLHRFAVEMIVASRGESAFLKRETVLAFWEGLAEPLDGSWKFGWDSPSKENLLIESGLSTKAVGECGFTGCSLWIEPERGLDIIVMTNRVHPSRSNKKIRSFRPELHAAIVKALGGL